MRLVKLVRDEIPRFLGGRHAKVVYGRMSHDEHIAELRKKLAEEALEYIFDPSVGELADVVEVAVALAEVDLGVDWHVIKSRALAKRRERGGFFEGMGMYVTD